VKYDAVFSVLVENKNIISTQIISWARTNRSNGNFDILLVLLLFFIRKNRYCSPFLFSLMK